MPFMAFIAWSVVFHAGLLSFVPTPAVEPTAPQRTIEIAYQGHVAALPEPIPEPDIGSPDALRPPRLPKENPLEKNARAIAEFIKKDILKISDNDQRESPFAVKEHAKKSISMPTIPGEMLKTPEYRSYYSLVREKIRKYAYFYYRKLEEGEVYLTFSLTPQGALKDIIINDTQSTVSLYLKEITLKSVTEAAPYPPFPQKLQKHTELAFNVIIDFELK